MGGGRSTLSLVGKQAAGCNRTRGKAGKQVHMEAREGWPLGHRT